MNQLLYKSTSRRETPTMASTRWTAVYEPGPHAVGRWRELVRTSSGSLVEMHPEVLLGERPDAERDLPVVLLEATGATGDADHLAVLAPKTVQLPICRGLPWKPRLPGLRLVGSRLLGADTDALIPTFADHLEKLIAGPTARYDCLLFEDLPVESPWWQAFAASRQVRSTALAAPQSRWLLRFPDTATTYWNRFSSKTRYNFRRQKRLFEHTWSVATDPTHVARFVAEAATVSSNSWQGRRLGERVRQDEASQEQLRTLARLGALRSYVLHHGDTPVAFAFGTQWNGRFVLEEIGYDSRFAEFSPGTVLLLNMLDDMFDHDTPQVLDFGFGDGAYKRLFGTEASESGSLLVVGSRLKTRLALHLHKSGQWCEQRFRAAAQWSGVGDKLRKLYRTK